MRGILWTYRSVSRTPIPVPLCGQLILGIVSSMERNGRAVIEVENLTAGYDGHRALSEVTFSVRRRTLAAVLGPNGSGKSTLLKVLVGLVEPWSGSASVLGLSPRAARPRIGYVPQVHHVDWSFPITVREVVEMGLYRPGWRFRRALEDRRRVREALRRLDLLPLQRRQLGELSGGQQRRVLIARALVRDPDVLLLDEPTAGLDAPSESQLMALLLSLRGAGKTILVATHDLGGVFHAFDYAICLNRRVIASGPPEVVMSPEILERTFGHELLSLHGTHRHHAGHHHRGRRR